MSILKERPKELCGCPCKNSYFNRCIRTSSILSATKTPDEKSSNTDELYSLAHQSRLNLDFYNSSYGSKLRGFLEILLSHREFTTADLRLVNMLLGSPLNQEICRCRLVEHIYSEISKPSFEIDLCRIFSYYVYLDLTRQTERSVVKNSNDPLIRIFSRNLASDKAVLASMRSYSPFALTRFGHLISLDGVQQKGGSRRTLAYRSTASVFQPYAKAEVLERTGYNTRSSSSSRVDTSSSPTNKKSPGSTDTISYNFFLRNYKVIIIGISTIAVMLLFLLIWLTLALK
jgi:hypothetical protein